MNETPLIPNLFRTEYSNIVSVLCKTYGLSHIELAEDFVSDSFMKATETWKLNGVPENPKAWLYVVAKNNAKDYFKHTDIFNSKIAIELSRKTDDFQELEIDLSEDNIKDSQLQMLFTICNPINSNESQIALALRILCGFSVDEIANALLSTKQSINKKLYRAKEKLRNDNITLGLPPPDQLESRLGNILSILYLLFNEGYFSSVASYTIRKELCFEAMRLLYILTENKTTNCPKANALMSMFCFHSSRFEARIDQFGEYIVYDEQDKTKWNTELILEGELYLKKSADETEPTKYHFEALIAFWHSKIEVDQKEKWEAILQIYNRLLQIEYSPITALNRTYALSKVKGKEIALKEAHKINLSNNFHFQSLLAELYSGIDNKKEREHLNLAIKLTNNEKDLAVLNGKLKKASLT